MNWLAPTGYRKSGVKRAVRTPQHPCAPLITTPSASDNLHSLVSQILNSESRKSIRWQISIFTASSIEQFTWCHNPCFLCLTWFRFSPIVRGSAIACITHVRVALSMCYRRRLCDWKQAWASVLWSSTSGGVLAQPLVVSMVSTGGYTIRLKDHKHFCRRCQVWEISTCWNCSRKFRHSLSKTSTRIISSTTEHSSTHSRCNCRVLSHLIFSTVVSCASHVRETDYGPCGCHNNTGRSNQATVGYAPHWFYLFLLVSLVWRHFQGVPKLASKASRMLDRTGNLTETTADGSRANGSWAFSRSDHQLCESSHRASKALGLSVRQQGGFCFRQSDRKKETTTDMDTGALEGSQGQPKQEQAGVKACH